MRGGMRYLGRLLLGLLTRTEVTGRDHLPASGPLLVVGNHDAALEVALLIAHTPWTVELLGADDVPPPRWVQILGKIHGYITLNRGHPDRRALSQALELLRQDGILAIFPQGGIWDPGFRPARRGVAWLSHRAGAPILPIGFGNTPGALDALLRLHRPRLSVNIGSLMPPVHPAPGVPRKKAYREAAQSIMNAVYALIPAEQRRRQHRMLDERFELRVALQQSDGTPAAPPPETSIAHPAALAKFFYRPAILDILRRNLHLPVQALQQISNESDPSRILRAIQPVIAYLEDENPFLLTYRFGQAQGQAMQAGLYELRDLSAWAGEADLLLTITPIRRYRLPEDTQDRVESSPGPADRW
jgi:1-acyl-sn-glycerol-3-phosphate acyltransferase